MLSSFLQCALYVSHHEPCVYHAQHKKKERKYMQIRVLYMYMIK